MTRRRVLYFAYGSNLDPARMRRRAPSAEFVGRTRLPGHELRFHKRGSVDGTGKADVWPTGSESDVVHGVLYRISTADLQALDRHESRGRGYERFRERFRVRGREVTAWIYRAQEPFIEAGLEPTAAYLAHLVEGALAHGLPSAVVRALREVEVAD